jgi:GntR family transcriptional regulator
MGLVRRFGVSRNTIREALRPLEQEGLIVRRRGRGTFVRTPPGPVSKSNASAKRSTTIRLVSAGAVRSPAHVAAFFGLARGEQVRRILRVESADGTPIGVHVDYVGTVLARKLRGRDLRRHSLLEFARDQLRIDLGLVRQIIEARMPDDETASLLAIDLAQLVLFQRLLVFDHQKTPLQVADSYYRADRYRYEHDMPGLPVYRKWQAIPPRSSTDARAHTRPRKDQFRS